MAELYDNKLCIEAKELIALDEKRNVGSEKGFIKESTYNKMRTNNHITVVRRSSPGFSALVEFDSMRRDIRERYIDIYGDPRDGIHTPGALEAVLQADEKAYQFFVDYRYGELQDKKLKPETIQEYTLQARVLNALIWLRDNKRRISIGGGGTKIHVWKHLSELCNELATVKDNRGRLLYPHGLPQNYASLKRKAVCYEQEGYSCLINRNYGNTCAAKVKEDNQQAVIHKLLSHHNNLNNELIRTMYNAIAEKKGWDEISSINTVENWRKKFGPEPEPGRRGVTELRNTITKQIKRSAPTKPLTYWTLDGWTAELLYQKRGKDGKGHNVSTYHHRLTIVFILDPCCKYPIGYAIGTKETPELIKRAMKNAVKHTKELFGETYKPYQIQSDNFGRGVMKPFFEACTHHYTPARAHNAKSKVVEPYNNYINKTYCQLFDNWSGFNITSDKDNQPNAEYLNKIRKVFPDEAGCYAQLEQIVAWERKKKQAEYLKAWRNVTEADKLRFTDEEYLLLFGETNGWTHSISGAGLEISINGQKYLYESFDNSLTYHFHERFVVRYDSENLDKVLISNAKADTANKLKEEVGSVRYVMEKRHVVPMALRDQSQEDFQYRARVDEYNKKLEAGIVEKMGKVHEQVEELFTNTPELANNNILERLCLTDSRGQHKNRRNELRSGVEDAKIIDTPLLSNSTQEAENEIVGFNGLAFLRAVRQMSNI